MSPPKDPIKYMEWRRENSEAHKGKKPTEKQLEALKLGRLKGRKGWNKNRHWSEATKKKMSETKLKRKERLGYINSPETIQKMRESWKGKKSNNCLEIWRMNGGQPWNRGKKWIEMSGKNHPQWKGGITPEMESLRKQVEFKLWRKSVFGRDDFTCQKYGIKGGKLVAHHINNFADYPELRTSIENGVTLSQKAHLEFHKKYGYNNNTEGQLKEYLGAIARKEAKK